MSNPPNSGPIPSQPSRWLFIWRSHGKSQTEAQAENHPQELLTMADWIQGAINPAHKGLLHTELGVPQGQSIPAKKLNAAAKKPGPVGKRARLAKTLKGFSK